MLEGTRLVLALVKRYGRAEVARKLKHSEVAVRHWCDERRVPQVKGQLALQRVYGIPHEAWEKPTTPPPPSSGIVATQAAFEPADEIDPGASAKDVIRETMVQIRNEIARARTNDCGPGEIAKLYGALAPWARLYSRLSGELEITESSILRSSAWARIAKVIHDAATPFPEASKAIGRALLALAGT